MASASSLLRWNPPFTHTLPRQNRTTLFCSKPPQRESISFRFQIAVKYKQSDSGPCQNPFDQIAIQIKKTLDSLKKPAIAAVLLGLLLFHDPNSALAASGGRIGGNSFSSRRSSSSSSYSVPRTLDQSSSTRYSAPYYGPSPLSGGLYVGPAVGFGFGYGGGFSAILVGLAAFIVVSGFLSDRRSQGGSTLTATQKTSVIKLQVE